MTWALTIATSSVQLPENASKENIIKYVYTVVIFYRFFSKVLLSYYLIASPETAL